MVRDTDVLIISQSLSSIAPAYRNCFSNTACDDESKLDDYITSIHLEVCFFSCIFSDKLSGDRVKQVMEHVWKFQEFCNSMTKLETDSYEYAYLKAIVLFSPGESALLNQMYT